MIDVGDIVDIVEIIETLNQSPIKEEKMIRDEMVQKCYSADHNLENSNWLADQILSLKLGNYTLKEWEELQRQGRICIKAKDQSLPGRKVGDKNRDTRWGYKYYAFGDVCKDAQQDMLNNNWKKVE